ncbi:alpha/beta hydrolase family protein [Actinocorallia aurea]
MLSAVRPGTAYAAPADTGATVVGEQEVRARTLDLTVATPSIPFMQCKIRIFTPLGWSKNAARTWPVLYVYGGGGEGGDYQGWDVMTDLKDYAAAWDVLVVMPEGGVSAGFTDWLRPKGGGVVNWETWHTSEVIQIIERNYRGGTDRAVMGISSGGQGAVTYAARHKGLFKYAASFSGILHMTKPGIPTMMELADMTSSTGATADQKWGDPVANRANWLAHDPYYLASNLRGVGLYLTTGTTGRPGPLDATWGDVLEDMGVVGGTQSQVVGGVGEALVGVTVKSFVARLKALGIPYTANIYGDGLHNWAYWNREFRSAWPHLMKALKAQKY